MSTEKKPTGRPTKYKPEYCQGIIDHMSEGASIASYAAELQVARSTITYWEDKNPEFKEAVEIGKLKCAAWWESTARKVAVEGGGAPHLIMFGLKNMAAEDWADRKQTDHVSSDGSMSPKEHGAAVLDALKAKHEK